MAGNESTQQLNKHTAVVGGWKNRKGTDRDKHTMITSWAYDRFTEEEENKQLVIIIRRLQRKFAQFFLFTAPEFLFEAFARRVQSKK
jgi:hypothetical protein